MLSPSKCASPSTMWGLGAKASALKASPEKCLSPPLFWKGWGAPRAGRSWRPRLGKVEGLRREATRVGHCHLFESNSLSRGGRRRIGGGGPREGFGELGRSHPAHPTIRPLIHSIKRSSRRASQRPLLPETRKAQRGRPGAAGGRWGTGSNTAIRKGVS